MTAAAVPLVRLAGSPVERGRQHGGARRAALRGFLADGLARLSTIMPEPVGLPALRPLLAQYQAHIEAGVPELAQEIRGLAQGAGISVWEALLLQVRREIIGYQRIPAAGDCTTYSRSGDGHPVLAQTVDLNGDLDDQICVLHVSGGARQSLVLSFGGLLGYLGVNSDGLAVGLNLVLGGQWRPGVPPYLAIRHVLDHAATVDEALGLLRGLRLASSRSLTLCDRQGTAWAEVLGDELRFARAASSTHANHFLHPDFAARDELNVFARNFSVLRQETARAALAALPPGAAAEDHFALLSAPPVCVPGSGDIRRERTVAAVVALPGRGELHVRPGDPSRSATCTFALDQASQSLPVPAGSRP